MENCKVIRGVCIAPFIVSLLVCIVSMFTGVSNGLFGVQTVDYGTDAFMWMLIIQIMLLWWLYIICIIGIAVTTIKIRKYKKTHFVGEESDEV